MEKRIQKLQKAKFYLEMLATGMDPTTQEFVDNELLNKQEIKNLFKFVGSCLQGNWAEAKSRKPSKLMLLREAPGENLTKGDPDRSNPIDNASQWGEAYAGA